MSKPLILITNDDGVFSKGISELIKLARPLGEILVVAPDKARSGQSSALTVTRPLLYDDIQVEDGLRIISCTGTPADCVKELCTVPPVSVCRSATIPTMPTSRRLCLTSAIS